jgi:membrane protein YqaA with SNARE-associated domain
MSLGGPGLFLIALADSSFLSLPEGNDILIIVLSTGQTWDVMAYYVLMTAMGSVVGCFILFSLGRRGGNFLDRRLNKQRMEDL